jgi:hypothetical protein
MSFIHYLTKFFDILAPYFVYVVSLLYLLYFTLFLGINTDNEIYVKPLKTYIRIFVGLFLILHFNPYVHKTNLSTIDSNIIMSSGTLILLDAGFSSLIEENMTRFNVKQRIQNLLL